MPSFATRRLKTSSSRCLAGLQLLLLGLIRGMLPRLQDRTLRRIELSEGCTEAVLKAFEVKTEVVMRNLYRSANRDASRTTVGQSGADAATIGPWPPFRRTGHQVIRASSMLFERRQTQLRSGRICNPGGGLRRRKVM